MYPRGGCGPSGRCGSTAINGANGACLLARRLISVAGLYIIENKEMMRISKNRTGYVVGFVLALILAACVFTSLQRSSVQLTTAVVPETVHKPADAVTGGTASEAAMRSAAAADPEQLTSSPSEASTGSETTTPAAARVLGSGEASYYGSQFAGRPTANGERFDPGGLTAAHRTLPFGSRVRVTNAHNGRSVVVRINDRGPFIAGRLIDVSRGAAEQLGMVQAGTAQVQLELLS